MDLINKGCEKLVGDCAGLKPSENALIISDEDTKDIGEAIFQTAKCVSRNAFHQTIPHLKIHGQEPPANIAQQMLGSDVIFCVTGMSMAHSKARDAATKNGARFLSLPGYSLDLLSHPALFTDYRALTPVCDALGGILSAGKYVRMVSEAGTDLQCCIEGRTANCAPGWCDGPGTMASPPDAETNIALIENASCGILVTDGSIPYDGLGVLDQPLKVMVEKGQIVSIEGGQKTEGIMRNLLWGKEASEERRILAELGIGLNPQAHLCGIMLVDEGTLGTVHIGVGANATIGGNNYVPFHIDLVMKNPSLQVDDKWIMEKGRLLCKTPSIS